MGNGRMKVVIALALVTALALGLAGPALAVAAGGAVGRYIVVFDDGVKEAAREALMARFGAVQLKEIALLGNAKVVLLPPGAVQTLAKRAEVVRIEEDAVVHALPKPPGKGKPPKEPPPQPEQEVPWGVDLIDADLAWATSKGAGISVAVLDTGIDKDHPDLAGNIAGGINFVARGRWVDPAKWDDDNGHGTHVAGTIAAIDNAIGVVGVAPEADLWAVKVLDKRGSGYVSDVILGIQWAIQNDVDVINMSLGGPDVASLRDACDAAYAAGIILVAAAGNSGDTDPDNDVGYPARYSSVIAVAAVDADGVRASWSADGAEVELAAPGVSVRSTLKDGEYGLSSGTSMASPHVAGTVALMLGAGLSSDNVRVTLQATADDLGTSGWDRYYGYGLVDAEEAATGSETP